nr:atherin-like [Aegilops tauschii subsp. strangulata]
MKWTPEADAALQELKAYLSSVPTLVAPKPQEPLLLYLAATNEVVSAALLAQREVDEAERGQIAAESEEDQNITPPPLPASGIAPRHPRASSLPSSAPARGAHPGPARVPPSPGCAPPPAPGSRAAASFLPLPADSGAALCRHADLARRRLAPPPTSPSRRRASRARAVPHRNRPPAPRSRCLRRLLHELRPSPSSLAPTPVTQSGPASIRVPKP